MSRVPAKSPDPLARWSGRIGLRRTRVGDRDLVGAAAFDIARRSEAAIGRCRHQASPCHSERTGGLGAGRMRHLFQPHDQLSPERHCVSPNSQIAL
jgi:hypothetical protein